MKSADIGVFVTVGPYPVDYLKFCEEFGQETAINLMKKGMNEAARLFEEKEIIAIGEIGRPHFPVDEQIIIDANEILLYGMQKAKDVGCPIVLHTESTTPEQCNELMKMGKKAGLGFAVVGDEGCSTQTLVNSDFVCSCIDDALNLLLSKKRLTATLRK